MDKEILPKSLNKTTCILEIIFKLLIINKGLPRMILKFKMINYSKRHFINSYITQKKIVALIKYY